MSQTGPWGSGQEPTFLPPQSNGYQWAGARPSWQPVTPLGTAPVYGTVPPPPQAPIQIPGQPPTYGQPSTGLPINPAYPGFPTYQQGPWPAPTPGRKPTKKTWLLALIVVVTVFVVVGPLISSLFSSEPEPVRPPTPPASTSASSSAASTSASSSASSSKSPSPTSSASTGTSTNNQYTPGPPDLNPDDPPYPKTEAEIDDILDDSPLYSQVVAPTDCEIGTIDLVNASVADIEQYMNEFVDCLMATWYPPVVGAGFTLPHPSVTVYTEEINSACGQLPLYNAAYCTADQQIYYAQDLILAFPSSVQAMRFLAESIIAHEFGHAVQNRTMIMISASYRQYYAETVDEAMDYSRRLELQADCLAGSFLNSVAASADLSSSDEDNIVRIFTLMGGTDPYSDDHGTGTNRAYWVSEGLHDWSVGVCNTFIASADQVS